MLSSNKVRMAFGWINFIISNKSYNLTISSSDKEVRDIEPINTSQNHR